MTNKEVIGLLDEIALLLDLSGESGFKSRAYTQVARQIERLDISVAQLVEEDRLREIKGVGDALEQKIVTLRANKDSYPLDDYYTELQRLLLELVVVERQFEDPSLQTPR